MVEVRLVDLDVIKRFSLAVRCDTVAADELLASLDASRDVVLAALDGAPDAGAKSTRRPRRAAAATGAPRAAATRRKP